MDNQFLDMTKWLQEKLDSIATDRFKVSNERQSNSDFFEGEVVVSALAGVPYKESANIPYQIDVFTADINFTMNALNILSKEVSNVPFNQIIQTGKGENDVPVYSNHRITPFFNTPVVMDKDLVLGSQHYARIVVFATMLVVYDVNDIKELEIDGEKIETLSSTLSYATEMFSNRVSGQPLNKSKKKAATVCVAFTMINKSSVFGLKVFKIATGQIDGNTGFDVKITLSDNTTNTLKMLIGNSALGCARSQLPSLTVSMYLFDNRGDQNNA